MKKLLTALECPFVDTVDLNVKSDVMRLVVWLEDRKIRELEISERELLKQSGSFDTAFVDYLARLQCPLAYTPTSQLACLNWLVGHAIGVEYEDSAEACKNLETTTGVGAGATGASGHRTTESTQALDREVNKLGALLGVPRATSDQGTADYLHTIAVKVRARPRPILDTTFCAHYKLYAKHSLHSLPPTLFASSPFAHVYCNSSPNTTYTTHTHTHTHTHTNKLTLSTRLLASSSSCARAAWLSRCVYRCRQVRWPC
jgi:hypothetical protein